MKAVSLLSVIFLFTILSCESVYKTYTKEVTAEKNAHPYLGQEVISREKIACLPVPLQRYLIRCGWVGKTMPLHAEVIWDEVEFKMQREKNWMPVQCLQFNSVPEPARFAYLSAPKLGINAFVGRDKYQHGKANMLIRLLGLFTFQDVSGMDMNESALVTILAEATFIPGYIFQPYIQWEEKDSSSVKATIKWNEVSVSGIFHFNEAGDMIRFESDDRNMTLKNGTTKKVHWIVRTDEYTEENGIRRPAYVQIIWQDEKGEYAYYRGRITKLVFD